MSTALWDVKSWQWCHRVKSKAMGNSVYVFASWSLFAHCARCTIICEQQSPSISFFFQHIVVNRNVTHPRPAPAQHKEIIRLSQSQNRLYERVLERRDLSPTGSAFVDYLCSSQCHHVERNDLEKKKSTQLSVDRMEYTSSKRNVTRYKYKCTR